MRQSLPVMLSTRKDQKRTQNNWNQQSVNIEVEENEEGETPLKDAVLSRKSHQVVPNWKNFRPELHKKTFYNGMNALHIGV